MQSLFVVVCDSVGYLLPISPSNPSNPAKNCEERSNFLGKSSCYLWLFKVICCSLQIICHFCRFYVECLSLQAHIVWDAPDFELPTRCLRRIPVVSRGPTARRRWPPAFCAAAVRRRIFSRRIYAFSSAVSGKLWPSSPRWGLGPPGDDLGQAQAVTVVDGDELPPAGRRVGGCAAMEALTCSFAPLSPCVAQNCARERNIENIAYSCVDGEDRLQLYRWRPGMPLTHAARMLASSVLSWSLTLPI